MSSEKSEHTTEFVSVSDARINERRVLRKLDWRLLPCISLFYLLNYLDRVNIGNAKVAGLVTDLGLTGLQYNICVAVFFVPYCLFEVPSNLLLKRTRPSLWIPTTMFIWSAVMVSMAFVKNYTGLVAVRFFLGLTEAGLLPGMTFFLCLWYPRDALARRMTVFLSSVTLAGAFGGILAWAIEKLDGVSGLAGWSWIFLIEGLVTAAVAIVAYFIMQDYPESSTFLTTEEKEWLIERLKADTKGSAKHFSWRFAIDAFKDYRSYIHVVLYLTGIVPNYAFAFFLPSIISGLGYSSAHAQLLSVPPYIFGSFFLVLFGFICDRYVIRGPLILCGSSVSLVGFVILYATSSPGAGYAGSVIAACGLIPTLACVILWAGGNAGGDVKRGVVLAMVIGIGNLGGIPASFIYRAQDAPRYHLGHGVCIGCLCVLIVTSVIGMVEYSRINRAKEAYCREHAIRQEEYNKYSDMGDQSPLYRYTL